jgi:hypothetical protein
VLPGPQVKGLYEWQGACERRAKPSADEEAERTAYCVELERMRVSVTMGEGI